MAKNVAFFQADLYAFNLSKDAKRQEKLASIGAKEGKNS